MKKFFLPLVVLILVVGCGGSGNQSVYTENAAVEKAAAKCGVTISQMNWLRDKIKESESEPSKKGSFYAIESSVGTIIIQQPLVSSRLPSLTYSCDGSVPTLSDQVIMNEIVNGMTEENKIFGL